MTDITIRPARLRDCSAITRIYARSVLEETASFELEPPDEAEIRHRMESLLEADFPYLVAEVEGKIAGYAYAGPYRPRPAYRFTVENTVYVDRFFWRRGVARTLLVKLIEECCAKDFHTMIGVIGGADHQSSIKLHESLGFEKVGHIKEVGFKHDQWLDSVLMQKLL